MSAPVPLQTATTLRGHYARGELSPVEVLEELVAHIEEREPELNALVTPAFDRALQHAQESTERWRASNARPLEGLPVLVKDLADTEGLRTTYGSGMYADYVPAADADVVARIRRAGGIVLAKSATHEFAWGLTTESGRFGATRNPWATDRTPGGSSGGSAAALAAGYAPLAIGSDTAGSIRIPAAFCGVAGLKPTYGAVDSAGVHPLAPSLDHVGPMARTVRDLRLLWSAINTDTGPAGGREAVAGALTVGVCTQFDGVSLGADQADACAGAAAALSDAGCRVVPVPAGTLPPAYPILAATVLTEGLQTHRDRGLWPDRADEYARDVRARLELAAASDPADYLRAQRDRAHLHAALSRLFTTVDVLLSPVSAIGPSIIGAAPADFRRQVLPYIAPQSLTGVPALALRAGFDTDGLPVGIQLTAPPWHEARLLDLGERYQSRTRDLQDRWPTATRQQVSPSTADQSARRRSR